jgi:ATP-dependent DNA ligase
MFNYKDPLYHRPPTLAEYAMVKKELEVMSKVTVVGRCPMSINFKDFIYFYPEKPVLLLKDTEEFNKLSKDPDYICEPKFNGSRCQLHLIDGVAHFWDRHGKELSYNTNALYVEGRKKIVDKLIRLLGSEGYYLFDCELRHNKVEGVQNKLVIFDIHIFKNKFLNRLTFRERRDILEKIFDIPEKFIDTCPESIVHLIKQYPIRFEEIFNHYSKFDEFEGVVIKNLNGKLNLGRTASKKSMWMFKVRKQTGRHRW